jgi:hypothetical protein
MVGSQPSFSRISLLSELRPRTPSGPGMCLMPFCWPSKPSTISIMPFMLTISVEPRLRGSRKSLLVMRRMPSTQSSMKVKERVCLPSPHISTSSLAVMALRQKAAGAFSRPPFHVP